MARNDGQRGFNLLEIVVVIIIIGILAVLAMPNYSKMREDQYEKDVVASLKLIMAAEKIYRLDVGGYFPLSTSTGSFTEINQNLKLALNENEWTYYISSPDANTFCAGAVRKTPTGTRWVIKNNSSGGEPVKTESTSCP